MRDVAARERKQPRSRSKLVVRFRRPSASEFSEGLGLHPSAEGLFVATPELCSPGTVLRLDCRADDGASLRATGCVMWVRKQAEGEERPSGMGVRFVRFEYASSGMVDRHLREGGGEPSESPGAGEPPGAATGVASSAPEPHEPQVIVEDGARLEDDTAPRMRWTAPGEASSRAVEREDGRAQRVEVIRVPRSGWPANSQQWLEPRDSARERAREVDDADAAWRARRLQELVAEQQARRGQEVQEASPPPAEKWPPRNADGVSFSEGRWRRVALRVSGALLALTVVLVVVSRFVGGEGAQQDKEGGRDARQPAASSAGSQEPSGSSRTDQDTDHTDTGRAATTVAAAESEEERTQDPPSEPVQQAEPPAQAPADSASAMEQDEAERDERAERREQRRRDRREPRRREGAQGERGASEQADGPAAVEGGSAELAAIQPGEPSSGQTTASAAVEGSDAPSPLQQAMQCLHDTDHACVVRALEGKATTAREHGLLIETYLALGAQDKAEASMREYIERFPGARDARRYRRRLDGE